MGHSRIKVLSLTALGKAVLGIDEPDSDRLGGPEHRYWKKRLAEHLRSQGWEVVEEHPLGGGKAIDLLATRDGKRVAIEVETGKSDAAVNIQKCLAAGVDEVVVVATSAQVQQLLAETMLDTPHVQCTCGAEAFRQLL